jgi:hypothetical protein
VTVADHRRPSRRQATALLAAVGAAVVLALLATGPGGAGASAASARTAEAETRDLRVTDGERGTLARSDTTTVLYDGTGGRADGGPAGSRVEAQAAGQATAADLVDDPCGAPTSTPTTGCTTTTTAEAPTSTTTTPAPATTTTSSTLPPDLDPPLEEAPIDPGAGPELDQGDQPDQGPAIDGRAPTADGAPLDGVDEGPTATAGPSTATLTELLAVGETAGRGSVLYRADDEPIVALLSATPLFRDLRVGVTDGPDVQAIESELRALGYGGFTVDEHYDASTAAAVQRWETDLGRSEPDGVVTVGEVRLLDEPAAVLEHSATVGDLLEPDDAVLVLGADSRVIEADVEAADAEDWAVGTPVEVAWPDGTTSTGSVVEVGRDVSDHQVPIEIALADGAGKAVPIGSRVDLARTVAQRTGAVAVPVSAVVQGGDGPAVRVVGDGDDRVVHVELGIVDDGWVEVAKGLEAGTTVRLPG